MSARISCPPLVRRGSPSLWGAPRFFSGYAADEDPVNGLGSGTSATSWFAGPDRGRPTASTLTGSRQSSSSRPSRISAWVTDLLRFGRLDLFNRALHRHDERVHART